MTMRRLAAGLILILALVGLGPALAVTPDEMLKDPAEEARARALSTGLRCMVCQNQSIDDSDADLAHDIRVLVRERIAAGDSDEAVIKFLVARYGDFILLKPPVNTETILLWAIPFATLALGIAAVLAASRRRRSSAAPAGSLTADERQRLERLLGKDQPSPQPPSN
jgi:cytochrome c-type biogenesis protein CcmH